MQEQEYPKLKIRDIENMTEEEAESELEKRGLLYDEMPEGSEVAMTIEEMEEANSGTYEMSYKEMLIESVVIDQNGVFIGEQPENEEEKSFAKNKPEASDRTILVFNHEKGRMERVTVDEDVVFEIPKYINRKIAEPKKSEKKEMRTLEELIKYL